MKASSQIACLGPLVDSGKHQLLKCSASRSFPKVELGGVSWLPPGTPGVAAEARQDGAEVGSRVPAENRPDRCMGEKLRQRGGRREGNSPPSAGTTGASMAESPGDQQARDHQVQGVSSVAEQLGGGSARHRMRYDRDRPADGRSGALGR